MEISWLDVLAGNQSMVDLPGLNVMSREQAQAFLLAYGFDIQMESDRKKLVYYARRAYIFLTEKLGVQETSLPAVFSTLDQVDSVLDLLLGASQEQERELQRWSCAQLRVMHAFIHAENDLFHLYANEIQRQILSPLDPYIVTEGGADAQVYLKDSTAPDQWVPLVHFEVKPHKTSVSSVMKLLSKAETHMINLHDKIGFRFVTRNIRDSFRVLDFLLQKYILSPAHVMAGQTTNTLYPVELLRKFIQEHPQFNTAEDQLIEEQLIHFQQRYQNEVDVVKKDNQYSAGNYRFIKFVARKLIRLPESGGQFFYPFEVQLLTDSAYQQTLQGEGDHKNYKQRQLEAARRRVIGDL